MDVEITLFQSFITGNEKCFQPFQYAQMVFVGLWCIPFPAALMFSYRLYMRYLISLRMLVLFIVFPCLAPFYFMYLLAEGRIHNANNTEVITFF